MTPVRIVIFAKAPVAGFAKTRLIPALGADGAAALARRFLRHAVQEALSASIGTVELCVTPYPADPVWRGLDIPAGVVWSDQGEGDLGARMARAAERTLQAGEAVLLIGTDCPDLDCVALAAAANELTSADVVIAPASDGGYVLLGLTRFDASLFTGMAWSTATVCEETVHRCEHLGWRLTRLPESHDIDEPGDLAWLPPDCRNAEHA